MLKSAENATLVLAVAAYLAGMLLLWAQLFFRADDATRQSQAWHRKAGRAGNIVLAFGAAVHLLSLLGQGAQLFSVQVGVAGLYGWILVCAYLLLGRNIGRGTLGAFVSPVVLLTAFYSLTAPALHPLVPQQQLQAQWLVVHIVIFLIAYVAFALAFAASLLYRLQEGLLKRKQLTGLWQRLPSLQVADEIIFRATAFGMAMLTLGIFTSAVWIMRHQPHYVVAADPKVKFILVTWLTFALYLAAHWWLGWRGRRTNLVVIYGFVLLVISFFGAQHVLGGAPR